MNPSLSGADARVRSRCREALAVVATSLSRPSTRGCFNRIRGLSQGVQRSNPGSRRAQRRALGRWLTERAKEAFVALASYCVFKIRAADTVMRWPRHCSLGDRPPVERTWTGSMQGGRHVTRAASRGAALAAAVTALG